MTDGGTTGASQPRGAWSRVAGPLLMMGAALLVALLIGELALRLLGVGFPVYVWTDPVRGVAHIPGAKSRPRSDGRSKIEINSDGWRGPDVALEPPPGTLRIALLGDSFIEAFEVNFEETVGELLGRRLAATRGGPVEVLNFGVGGYGTAQEYLTLQREVWKYSPDLVLLAITTGNDISDNSRVLSRDHYAPYFVYRGNDLTLDTTFLSSSEYRNRAVWTRRLLGAIKHSRLLQLLNRVRHTRRKSEQQQANAGGNPADELGLRDEVQLPPATPDWQEAWRVTEGILRLMRDECRQRNTPFAMVTLTRGIQVTPVPQAKESFLRELGAEDLYYPERRLTEFGRREGIPTLNLAPAMAQEAERRQVFFHAHRDSLGIGHWNVEGHQAAARLLADWLPGVLDPRVATSSGSGPDSAAAPAR